MNQNSTFGHLAAIMADYDNISENNPCLAIFIRPKMENFIKQNRGAFLHMNKVKQSLVDLHVFFGESLNPQTVVNEKGETVFDFKSEEDKESFLKSWDEFSKRTVKLIV